MTARQPTQEPEADTDGFDGGAPPVEERVSFLIHKVNARLAQIVNRVFRDLGLDLYSSRILVFLLERREMRVGELVEAMVLPQSTISHQLQRLERRNLIRRRRTKEDNRSVAVVLTPVGEEVARRCNDLSLTVYAAVTASLNAEELAGLRLHLRKIFDSLGEFRDAPLPEATRPEA